MDQRESTSSLNSFLKLAFFIYVLKDKVEVNFCVFPFAAISLKTTKTSVILISFVSLYTLVMF